MAAGLEVPDCDRCSRPAILHQAYSGRQLCERHLVDLVQRRVTKELRQQLQIPRGASQAAPFTILVAISGGKDSALLLQSLVDALGPRRDVRLVAGSVDEGITGYRPPSLERAAELADRLGVTHEVLAFTDLGARPMDDIQASRSELSAAEPATMGLAACSFCGVFRREGINTLATRVGAHVVALGHNLDDMAQTALMNLQKGEVERLIRLAPHSADPLKGLPPRIVPLRMIPEREVHAVARALGLPFAHDECPHAPGAYRWRQREIIAAMERSVPGARHGLLRAADRIKALWYEPQDLIEPSDSPDSSPGASRAASPTARPDPRPERTPSAGAADPVAVVGSIAPPPISRWTARPPQSCERCGAVTSQPLCQACRMRGWLRVLD